MDIKKIWTTFLPIFLSFICYRIILQTDIIMVSFLGELQTAAFGIPAKIMIFDMIIAFAMAPVVSILVASSESHDERKKIISKSLALSFLIGISLVILGLSIYPSFVKLISSDETINYYAFQALFYLTIAIPARLVFFVASMCLYGIGRGMSLIRLNILSIILNFLLNWTMIYYFGLGFKGCYISTFIVSHVGLIWAIYLLKNHISGQLLFKIPDFFWIKNFFVKVGAEWWRLTNIFLSDFVMLYFIAHGIDHIARLSAYSVIIELIGLILIPMIAFMRSIAITLAPISDFKNIYVYLKKPAKYGLLLIAPISLLLLWQKKYIGNYIYHLSDGALLWWTPFLVYVSLGLPIFFINFLQRGAWHSQKKFGFVSLIDSSCKWLIHIPILYFGLKISEPWVAWSGILISEVVIALLLYLNRQHLLKPPQLLQKFSIKENLATPAT